MGTQDNTQLEELQAKIRDYEKVLGVNNQDLLITFKLTPCLNSIFGLLLSQKMVTAEMVEHRLGIASEARVAIWRLRSELKEWGIEIESKRRIGYWLSHDTKIKVQKIIDQEITPEVKPVDDYRRE